MLTMISGGDFYALKGVLEELLGALNPRVSLTVKETEHDILQPSRSCELWADSHLCGYLGEVSDAGLKLFSLRARPGSWHGGLRR